MADLGRAAAEAERGRTVWGDAVAASLRGAEAMLSGRAHDATQHITHAISGLREVGDVCTLVLALDQLSRVREAEGRLADAEAALLEALETSTAHNLRSWQATTSIRLGSFADRRDDAASARRFFEAARVLAGELASPAHEAEALHGLGRVHRRSGKVDDALHCLTKARELAGRAGLWNAAQPPVPTQGISPPVDLLLELGRTFELAGDSDGALRSYEDALDEADQHGNVAGVVAACDGLAGVVAALGDGSTAARLLGYAERRRTDADRDVGSPAVDQTRAHCVALLGQAECDRLFADGQNAPRPPARPATTASSGFGGMRR